MKTAIGIATGLIFWITAQVIALGLAGGGDGWDGPAVLSLAMAPLCPSVFARIFQQRLTIRVDGTTLLIAGALDAVLLYDVQIQEPGYFAVAQDIVPSLVFVWLALWAGWQLVALGVFARSSWREESDLPNVR